MEKRTEQILITILKEHIATGQPVGSEAVATKCKLGVSSATIRNEMAELEAAGYIAQPHTSAGRIPTERAYRYYLATLKDKALAEKEQEFFNQILIQREEHDLKQTAKALAAASGLAVFWAFHKHNLYYTGVANLLSQPEFSQTKNIYDISIVIDSMEEVIDQIFDQTEFGTHVLLGEDNPFGVICSTILNKYKLGDNTGMFGIIGPQRMNYEKNLALSKFINSLLK